MKTFLKVVVGFATLSLICSCQKQDSDISPIPVDNVQRVNMGTYSLSARVIGNKGPTVVLLSGLYTPWSYWHKVQSGLSNSYTTIAYDRAGYDMSDLPDGTRDASTIADELYALLRKKNLKAPYILVGHSLGGAFAQVFAAKYNKEVGGVILADATTEKQLDFTELISDVLMFDLNYKGAKREIKAAKETVDQIRYLNGLPDVPLVVITNIQPSSNESENSKKLDFEEQSKWLKNKTKAVQWKAKKGHTIPINEAELIIEAVKFITL